MCGNYGSAPGHLTTGALHVAPMVVARAFTPPETAWQVGRPVAQAVVPCSNSPGNGRYRCFRGARNSPRESQFWPFNRLPWLGHAWLDFGKLNGQRAVPCPRGGVCALRGAGNTAGRFWPFFGAGGRFSPRFFSKITSDGSVMRDQEPPTAHISVRHMCGRRWEAGERLATRSSHARDHSAHITEQPICTYIYVH